MKRVVDASVAIKWFVPEIHAAAALRLYESDVLLFAPDLIGPELGNILWKKVRRSEIDREDARDLLVTLVPQRLLIDSSQDYLGTAFNLAVTLACSAYDSLYLALAIERDCMLVTADAKFHNAVARSPFADHIQWIEELS